MNLTPAEVRVVGCLVEKQLATPGSYPLTVNALVAACNQTSNRHPVVAYDEATVEQALRTLREKGLTRIVYSPQNRAPKHRHVLDEVLDVEPAALAVLAVLLLRGPQTPGELRSRTERLATFDRLEDVEHVLEGLATRPDPLVVRLPRQPGQKEARYAHLLGDAPPEATSPSGSLAASPAVPGGDGPDSSPSTPAGPPGGLPGGSADDRGRGDPAEARLAALEAEVAALRADVRRLQEELGVPPVDAPAHLPDEVPY